MRLCDKTIHHNPGFHIYFFHTIDDHINSLINNKHLRRKSYPSGSVFSMERMESEMEETNLK